MKNENPALVPGFETTWAQLRPRLYGLLRSRGASHEIADDVIQEAAVRLLRRWDRLDFTRPIWPLAKTVVLHRLIDQHRERVPEPISEIPDEAAAYDLEEHGLARARLGVVADALHSLSPADRATLLAEVGEADRPANSSAAKMARMRARERLVQMMDRIAAAFSAVPVACRRLQIWLASNAPADLQGAMMSAGGAAVAVTIAITTLQPVAPPTTDGHRGRPERIALSTAHERNAKRSPSGRLERELKEAPIASASVSRDPTHVDDRPDVDAESSENDRSTNTTEAGPARATTRKDENGWTQGIVCTGEDTPQEEDDHEVTVAIDGNKGDDEPEECEN